MHPSTPRNGATAYLPILLARQDFVDPVPLHHERKLADRLKPLLFPSGCVTTPDVLFLEDGAPAAFLTAPNALLPKDCAPTAFLTTPEAQLPEDCAPAAFSTTPDILLPEDCAPASLFAGPDMLLPWLLAPLAATLRMKQNPHNFDLAVGTLSSARIANKTWCTLPLARGKNKGTKKIT